MSTIRTRTWAGGTKSAYQLTFTDQNGVRRSEQFAKRKDARTRQLEVDRMIEEGSYAPISQSITVAEAAKQWLDHCWLLVDQGEREYSTWRQYKVHVDHIAASKIARSKLALLKKPTVAEFRNWLIRAKDDEKGGRGLTSVTARKVLTSLKTLISAAQENGLVATNVALDVKFGKRERKEEIAIPTPEEIHKILDHAGRWHTLNLTAAFTGLRSSELRGLQWRDVDLDQAVLHVRRRADERGTLGAPKSKAGIRVVPLTPSVRKALIEHKLASKWKGPTDFVFCNTRGTVYFQHNILGRGFVPVQKRAGVQYATGAAKYGLHALRHFFASWAIDRGFSPKKVQTLLGHSSIVLTFDRYGHLFKSPEDDAAKFAAGDFVSGTSMRT